MTRTTPTTTEPGPAAERREFVAGPPLPLDRLDKCIAAALSDAEASRTAVARWIAGGLVTVDGVSVTSPKQRVSAGAQVVVRIPKPPRSQAAPDAGVSFGVLFEDEHILVIDKPAHLVVHPAHGHPDKTLVNGLLARGLSGDLTDDPDGPPRPGIVHRLDKGTSGVMVVAKTAEARLHLKALFTRHELEREYLALVIGKARDATFDTPHGRHPTERLRFSSKTRDPRARRAITHVKLSEHFPATNTSLVVCTLETGRTHQIRVHLSEQLKTPVLGDPLYGGVPRRGPLAELGKALARQALHARLLGFAHPVTGQKMTWEAPLPEDFERALEWARRGGSP